MKPLYYICAFAAALLCGCNKPATQSGGDDSGRGRTSVPISGAWGFTLGERLPEDAPGDFVKRYFWAKPDPTNKPFSLICCACLADRTICQITGEADEFSVPAIQEALVSKYGSFAVTTNDHTRHWTNGNFQIDFEIMPSGDGRVT